MLRFKELDDKKKRLIIIVSVLVVFIGVTLAYVVGQISDGAIGNANVTADTTDNLQFSVDKDISLNPTQFNVTEGGGGLSNTAVGTATLLANSTNETATYEYYVYFNIKSNDYTYTTEDYKPEIVLTITDPEGNLVTELANSDLEYVEAENADGTITKGFDITTASGLINIASLYEITSNSSTDATVQDWTFTVTFINLTTNQSANGGSTLDAEIIIQKEPMESEELAYHETCTPGTMACDIARLYTEDGVNDLYYHDGSGTYGAQEAGDNSYRYAGANPNNYVCFVSDAATCPNDNLYRIIGVFGNQVKLIKHDYTTSTLLGTNGDYYGAYSYSASYYKGSMTTSNVASYFWNRNRTNTWSESQLNTVNLNTNYLNNIGSKWSSLIATTNWKVGGMAWSETNTAKQYYTTEIGSSSSSTTYSAKIGLMYVSDYGYAASPANWSIALYNYDNDTNRNNNWMYMGLNEWTISRRSDASNRALAVSLTGDVGSNAVVSGIGGVRPSFYLESSVVLESGDGTQENPYRIEI